MIAVKYSTDSSQQDEPNGETPPNQIDNATIMGIITVLILIRAVLAVLNTGDTMSATTAGLIPLNIRSTTGLSYV